ncbi:MAG: radical SAM protein [Desulfobulbaceae bacterium]|jgi:7-carboxy-7-deazaguanine synthase|nr:radical SAM protein [Desulfobulbaceae bacterium]
MAKTELLVSELFYSIQGESSFAGLPCLFFRLHGCNLRCRYCDSRYSFTGEGQVMDIADLLARAKQYPRAIVEITGGEPLTQAGAIPLLTALLAAGRTVLLETNGSLPIAPVPEMVHIILDVKCPGSGNPIFCQDNLAELARRNHERGLIELKFVLSSREDYLFARDFTRRHPLPATTPIWLSPVSPVLPLPELAAWMLEDEFAARLHPQLHTIIWPQAARGR